MCSPTQSSSRRRSSCQPAPAQSESVCTNIWSGCSWNSKRIVIRGRPARYLASLHRSSQSALVGADILRASSFTVKVMSLLSGLMKFALAMIALYCVVISGLSNSLCMLSFAVANLLLLPPAFFFSLRSSNFQFSSYFPPCHRPCRRTVARLGLSESCLDRSACQG